MKEFYQGPNIEAAHEFGEKGETERFLSAICAKAEENLNVIRKHEQYSIFAFPERCTPERIVEITEMLGDESRQYTSKQAYEFIRRCQTNVALDEVALAVLQGAPLTQEALRTRLSAIDQRLLPEAEAAYQAFLGRLDAEKGTMRISESPEDLLVRYEHDPAVKSALDEYRALQENGFPLECVAFSLPSVDVLVFRPGAIHLAKKFSDDFHGLVTNQPDAHGRRLILVAIGRQDDLDALDQYSKHVLHEIRHIVDQVAMLMDTPKPFINDMTIKDVHNLLCTEFRALCIDDNLGVFPQYVARMTHSPALYGEELKIWERIAERAVELHEVWQDDSASRLAVYHSVGLAKTPMQLERQLGMALNFILATIEKDEGVQS